MNVVTYISVFGLMPCMEIYNLIMIGQFPYFDAHNQPPIFNFEGSCGAAILFGKKYDFHQIAKIYPILV